MQKNHRQFSLGWKPDLPDHRDKHFTLTAVKPASVYLAAKYKMPPIYDQLTIGSCTSNSVAKIIHFDLINKHSKSDIHPFLPSRLFIYYYTRLNEGSPLDEDTGATIRGTIKTMTVQGAPSEDVWIYDVNKFTIKPTDNAIKLALNLEALQYQRIDNTNKLSLIAALQQGFPISFGMTVYDSFMTDKVAATGIVPMPAKSEEIVGGHALVIVGYHAEDDSFIVCNSWGHDWGQGGYCRIPAKYICDDNLCDDFWIVTLTK